MWIGQRRSPSRPPLETQVPAQLPGDSLQSLRSVPLPSTHKAGLGRSPGAILRNSLLWPCLLGPQERFRAHCYLLPSTYRRKPRCASLAPLSRCRNEAGAPVGRRGGEAPALQLRDPGFAALRPPPRWSHRESGGRSQGTGSAVVCVLTPKRRTASPKGLSSVLGLWQPPPQTPTPEINKLCLVGILRSPHFCPRGPGGV